MTSVKQKIAGIGKKREEIQSGVRKIGSGIEKEREKIQAGVRKMQGAIKDLGKINASAARELRNKARQLEEEMKRYAKDFYFGEGKTEEKK